MRSFFLTKLVAVAMAVSAIGACSGGAATDPAVVGEQRSPSGDERQTQDSSVTGQPSSPTDPVDPIGTIDTAIAAPVPRPAVFTLEAVTAGVASATDTTRLVLLGGLAVSLYRVESDGSTGATLVATGTSSSRGEIVFRDLPSAHYRLDVKALAGSGYNDGSATIAPPWSSPMRVRVVLSWRG